MAAVHPVVGSSPAKFNYRWFPSFRMLTATLLCLCFASVQMMNSNMGMAIVCMVNSSEYVDLNSSVLPTDGVSISEAKEESLADMLTNKSISKRNKALRLDWNADEQGYIFGAFNLGLLSMLGTGLVADKFNAKYMIIASVLIASMANLIIATASSISVYFAISGRLLVGISDALLQPSVNSLITRWFSPAERSYALGLATGGRQLGTLVIVPASGALCSQTVLFGGWPAIFYLSASVGILFVVIYMFLGADKPSKQTCISDAELKFITASNSCEDIGKKRIEREIPWMQILKSAPVWSTVVAVICHEFPLMTMIMFLPSYLHDVHHYTATENGILSALPTACLWISKIFSSYLNTFLQRRTKLHRTTICKLLNTIASCGLAFFLFTSTTLDASHASLAVVFLCASMASAGLHTPGCQTALVSLAPAFSGAITGLAFFFVASAGIVNPVLTKWIVRNGTHAEWSTIFYISTLVALIPVVIFNFWGSAEVQWWAKSSRIYPEFVVASVCPKSAMDQTIHKSNNAQKLSSSKPAQHTASV